MKSIRIQRENKGRIKDRMGLRAEGDAEANSMKCLLKWTMRGQLLARGRFSSGHQASHHGDTNVSITTDPPRDADTAKTLLCSYLILYMTHSKAKVLSSSGPHPSSFSLSFSLFGWVARKPHFLNKALVFPIP